MAKPIAKKKGSQSNVDTVPVDDNIKRLESMILTLAEKVDTLASSQHTPINKLPRVDSPDVAAAAMHKARIGEDPTRRSDVIDRKYPFAPREFQEGDFITIKEDCPLYKDYMVIYDDRNKPQPVGDETICDKCGASSSPRAVRCKTKECKGTPIRTEIPATALPAIGRIKKALYVKKNGPKAGEWKYLVWFDGFGTKDAGGEGLMASEMELWQQEKN